MKCIKSCHLLKKIGKYVNENNDVKNAGYGCYDDKFYFAVLCDDKAGWDPENDWSLVNHLLDQY